MVGSIDNYIWEEFIIQTIIIIIHHHHLYMVTLESLGRRTGEEAEADPLVQ